MSITVNTQLSTFDVIRDVIRGSLILSQRFKRNNFHQYEPNLSSVSFDMLPYIVINIPESDTESLTINHAETMIDFNVTILLVVDWVARSKFLTYANEILYQLQTSDSSFEAKQYYNNHANMINTTVDGVKGKQAIVGTIELTLQGIIQT